MEKSICKKKVYGFVVFQIVIQVVLFTSCENFFAFNEEAEKKEIKTRQWTNIVYMAADNDLESSAIYDFNEMEAADTDDYPVETLVLFDRAVGYDGTNENWTDTRLYKIKHDPAGKNGTIVSERLECPLLDLYTTRETELDMADLNTLKNLLRFAKNEYPAKNYSLIIWGHGTGWRGISTSELSMGNSTSKAIAIDDTTGSYMSISQLGNALSELKISVVGFDTCFGALLECAYELSGKADFLVGSANITPTSGWDYCSLLESFCTSTYTGESFSSCIVNQFMSQYVGVDRATISVVKLDQIEQVKKSLDDCALSLASEVSSLNKATIKDSLRSEVENFCYSQYPCDMYLDVYSLADKIENSASLSAIATTSVKEKASVLKDSVSSAVFSWSATGSTNPKLGVFFSLLESRNVIASTHSDAYVKGSGTANQSRFVKESYGWVPTVTRDSGSLLDKLFYVP